MATSNPQKYGINQWAARPLASLFAVAYLIIATATGVLLSLVPDEGKQDATGGGQVVTGIPTALYTTTPRTPHRITTTTATAIPSVPPGYREVSGSFQFKSVVPTGWEVADGSVSTTKVATDPADARREIRFGGAPPENAATDLTGRIGQAAAENTLPGYRKKLLEPSKFHGYPAMSWDFEFTKNDVRRQVSAFYWEAQNVEYIIYASTVPDDWPAMQTIVQTMKDRVRP